LVLAGITKAGLNAVAYPSTGFNYDSISGWEENGAWAPPTLFIDGYFKDLGVRIADVNGDGLVDIMKGKGSPNTYKTWLNTGNGWEENETWAPPTLFIDGYFEDLGVRIADVNGDGLVDIMKGKGSPNTYKAWINSNNNTNFDNADYSTPGLLNGIRHSNGALTTIGYTPSTQYDNTGNDSISDLPGSIWVVSQLVRDNGMTGSDNVVSTTNYTYKDGMQFFNPPEEIEFRGFGEVVVANNYSETTHLFHQDDVLKGIEYHTEVRDKTGNLYDVSDMKYNSSQTYDGVNLILLDSESHTRYDGTVRAPDNASGRTSLTEYTEYDSYGNPLSVTDYGDTAVQGDERYYSYEYASNADSWILGKTTHEMLNNSAGEKVSESWYYYDHSAANIPSRGLLTEKVDWNDMGEDPASLYDYDSYGNVINMTDPEGHSKIIGYDDNHLYPVSVTNALGQTESYEFNDLGRITGITDSNGIATEYVYDDLHRIHKVIKPYDTEESPSIEYTYSLDGVAPEFVSTKIKEAQFIGDGTESDPYRIYNISGLQAINNNLSAHYILMNDIDASETRSWNSGAGFAPLGPSYSNKFTGSLGGQGYTIDKLYISRTGTYEVGLFGTTGQSSEISNVKLTNVNITGNQDVGGIVGLNLGNVKKCYVSGDVSGTDFVGGIVGDNYGGLITESYTTASVSGTDFVGGFVGGLFEGTLSDSFATGPVVGTDRVGGFVGGNDDIIEDCYSLGLVMGSTSVGGFCGGNYDTINDCYYDSTTSGKNDTGKGTPKTTPQMQNQSTFAGWDFEDIWVMQGYPELKHLLLTFDSIDSYDGFGNLITRKYEGEDGWIYQNTTYNELGLEAEVEVPHSLNDTALSVEYEYDAMSRVTTITNTDNTTQKYHYELENTTITNQNGVNKTLTSDIFGNIITVYEFNEGETYVTSYSYDAMNNLIEIIPDSETAGHNTQLNDPIINGEFDGTTAGWSFDGPSYAAVNDTNAYEGDYCAYIDYNGENAIVNGTRISQTIRVPDVPGTLKLEFYERTKLRYWAGSCGIKFDDDWVFRVFCTTPDRRGTTTNWAKQSINISEYKGQTVDLSIIWHDPSAQYHSYSDHLGWIRVDDIQIVQDISGDTCNGADNQVYSACESSACKVSVDDPDMGNRTCEYDLKGNLVNRTDATETYDPGYNATIAQNTTIANQKGTNKTIRDACNNITKTNASYENETNMTSCSYDAMNSLTETIPKSQTTEHRVMQLNGDDADPIINGEFDGTTTGWSFDGPSYAAVSDTNAYEGSYCAYIDYGGENAIVNGTRISQTIRVPDVQGTLRLEFYERTFLQNWAGQCGIKFDDDWVFRINYDTPGRRSATTNWAKQSIDISEYKGQTVDLSIIWHDPSAQYHSYGDHVGWIRVDDIQIVQEISNNHVYFTYDSLGRKVAMSDPDMGEWTYEYDLNGNLVSQTDARCISTLLTYDDLNRVTSIDYPNDEDVSFTYDLEYNGTLSRVVKGSISSAYDYDQRYRVEDETLSFGFIPYTYTTSYEYDSMDRVTRITYPDASSVNLTYNAQTLLESVEGVVDNLDYNARNQITTKELSNGVVTNYTYDTEKLLLDRIYTPGLQDLNYEFDNVGNILEIEDDVLDSVKTYGYDDLDRLISADMEVNSVPSYQRDFTYDRYGCIRQVDENSVPISTYSYNMTPFHAPLSYNGNTLNYDANGNLIEDENFIYIYNDANQLSEVQHASNNSFIEKYWYDAEGKRVKKLNSTYSFTFYVNQFYEITNNNNGTRYFFRDDERVAKETAGDMEWYLSDHLGSTTLLINESGLEVERTEYYPYGAIESGGSEKYGFTGQENDADTGLMYYGVRYYSPEVRVFTQPDTLLPDPYNPQALNRYSYAQNNPVRYTDPSGHYIESGIDLAFIAMDLNDIRTGNADTWTYVGLGVDLVCLALPGATGGRLAVSALEEGVTHADNVGDLFNLMDTTLDAERKLDNVIDSGKTANHIGNTGKVLNQLPNVENAQIDPRKLTEYALDPKSDVGSHKARVFKSALGYDQSNADDLMKQIYDKLPESQATVGKLDNYGQRYTVDLDITGANGNVATVRTGWIIGSKSDSPRLTTLMVK
jgi:RHS repeat-associated protein